MSNRQYIYYHHIPLDPAVLSEKKCLGYDLEGFAVPSESLFGSIGYKIPDSSAKVLALVHMSTYHKVVNVWVYLGNITT